MPRTALDTPRAARRSLAGLMRQFQAGKFGDVGRFRGLVHAHAVLLAHFKHEHDVDALEDLRTRIEALEDAAGLADVKRRLDDLEGKP